MMFSSIVECVNLVWSLLFLFDIRRTRFFLPSKQSNRGKTVDWFRSWPVSRPNCSESFILGSLSWVDSVRIPRLADFSCKPVGYPILVVKFFYNMPEPANVVLCSFWCYIDANNDRNVQKQHPIATLLVQVFKLVPIIRRAKALVLKTGLLLRF